MESVDDGPSSVYDEADDEFFENTAILGRNNCVSGAFGRSTSRAAFGKSSVAIASDCRVPSEDLGAAKTLCLEEGVPRREAFQLPRIDCSTAIICGFPLAAENIEAQLE